MSVDDIALLEKADTVALGSPIFEPRVAGFKAQHGLVHKTISEEEKTVDKGSVTDWIADLPSLLGEYEPKNIFNAGDAGTFINEQPEKSLRFKGKTKSKKRITMFFCCNADVAENLRWPQS